MKQIWKTLYIKISQNNLKRIDTCRDVIKRAAQMVSCPKEDVPAENRTEAHCILYDEWLEENSDRPSETPDSDFRGYTDPEHYKLSASGVSVFQSMFGISSLELSLKNRHVTQGDAYPYAHTLLDTR
jgi:hypothetical protein